MPDMLPDWLLVGPGRCGLQLGRSMVAGGLALAAVVVHSPRARARVRRSLADVPVADWESALPAAEALLLAVPDRAVAACAGSLAERLERAPRVVLHTSGLLPATVLAPLRGRGCSVGSWHPLLSFASATGPLVPLKGAIATVEGDPAAVTAGRRLARRLGMTPHLIDGADKPLYHAAAAVAANLTHVLVAAAREELGRAGFSKSAAARSLRPLVMRSLEEAFAAHGLERLSGPIARGDGATVRAHIGALPPALAACYRAVGRLAVSRLESRRDAPEELLHEVLNALTNTC
jgi:predicted short-subunit dehydrogenase-like oxidoreductase (DUF2520 family)